ncbi:MAG: rhodanese-like domain-containing protein [Erysipelotrichaceae bacterium]|nr:rhodanese-like domain-containing protein [Erysipelotrichaceae bacterium]
MKKFFVILVCVIGLVGCSNQENKADGIIDYVEAKEKIINNGAILIDVRTEEEFNEDHIDGSLLLPLDTINETSVSDVVDSKDTPIIVYCRSGNRSHQAYEKLKEFGYNEVYDLGAITNWKE